MESRSRTLFRRSFVSLLLLFAFCLLTFDFQSGSRAAQAPSVRTQIDAGKRVYSGSCGMSYCHGSEGIGGGGPKLRGREFSPEYLTLLITEGVPGTIMPGFKNSLSKQQIAQLVAYLVSLSPNKGAMKPESGQQAADPHLSNPAPKTEAAPKPPPETAPSTVVTNDSSDLRGDAEAGRSLFFDSAEMQNCRVCHTVQERGGKIGPDLTALANRSPREILQSIVAPHSRIDEKYAMIAITTRGAEKFVGVKRDENETTIRLYDTSSLPPVSRAFAKSEVAKIEKLNTSAMPGDYASRYSFKQLLDLVSFLKSADQTKPASVSLKELF